MYPLTLLARPLFTASFARANVSLGRLTAIFLVIPQYILVVLLGSTPLRASRPEFRRVMGVFIGPSAAMLLTFSRRTIRLLRPTSSKELPYREDDLAKSAKKLPLEELDLTEGRETASRRSFEVLVEL